MRVTRSGNESHSKELYSSGNNEAVRTQSRELILGFSLSEFMRKLGMQDDSGSPRGDRTRLRNQMDQLFSATVSLIYKAKKEIVSGHYICAVDCEAEGGG